MQAFIRQIMQFELAFDELSTQRGYANIETIKNFLICETDYNNIERLFKYLGILWDTPIDSVNNTPLHIVVNAEYMNLPLLEAIPDSIIIQYFYTNINSIKLNPLSYLIANWNYVEEKYKDLYIKMLNRVIKLIPPEYFKSDSLVLYMAIESRNIHLFNMLKNHPNFQSWLQLPYNGNSILEFMRQQIVKTGLREDNYINYAEMLNAIILCQSHPTGH